ncbi:MAG: SUF system Fe-S cluster assembly regulator [Coxiella sp. RIFCSPHIGHO2_12_FULL_42_15]|nr:MAG: SUF system Fe-S cluster assembly regulator [Coxiella sp. RIFCSPHIGHO2_12_FULL_42_15]
MIKISRLADYGTLILSRLANKSDQRLSAHQISEDTQLPIPTVSKLLKLLNEANIVSSTRGANGGYQLNRPPDKISVAEIIYAIDGPLAMTECSKSIENCTRHEFCGLRHNWQYINSMILLLLQQLSLADMNQPLKKVISLQVLANES